MASRAGELLRFWSGFRAPVSRRAYLLSGLSLAAVKLVGDLALLWVLEGRPWSPAQLLSPVLGARLPGASTSTLVVLGLWTLPFAWIGASMTFRRAVDAGLPGGTALLFFAPYVNYLFLAVLCVLPHRRSTFGDPVTTPPWTWQTRALLACGAGAALGLLVVLAAMRLGGGTYGYALFLASPFAIGFVAAAVYGAEPPAEHRPGPHAVAQIALLAAAGGLLLFAFEGVICLAMAYPIAAALAFVGSVLGALPAANPHAAVVVALVAPLLAAMEPVAEPPLREVVSAIEVDAPPEVVWRHVTSFSELPPPDEWVFAAGIAYPVRARYEGYGEDAVRYCEFSTGPFVEPITRWEEPTRLSFDVAAQPPTMEEWSPYRQLEPAHLVDGLRAVRGEFRLTRRPDGGTRLEGSTWYRLRMFPQPYWTLWSDALIHRIHRRVLRHVRTLSEEAASAAAVTGGLRGSASASPAAAS